MCLSVVFVASGVNLTSFPRRLSSALLWLTTEEMATKTRLRRSTSVNKVTESSEVERKTRYTRLENP